MNNDEAPQKVDSEQSLNPQVVSADFAQPNSLIDKTPEQHSTPTVKGFNLRGFISSPLTITGLMLIFIAAVLGFISQGHEHDIVSSHFSNLLTRVTFACGAVVYLLAVCLSKVSLGHKLVLAVGLFFCIFWAFIAYVFIGFMLFFGS